MLSRSHVKPKLASKNRSQRTASAESDQIGKQFNSSRPDWGVTTRSRTYPRRPITARKTNPSADEHHTTTSALNNSTREAGKSEGARKHTLGDEPLDGDVGVHAAVAERGVDLAFGAVGKDPLEALHHLPGGGRDRRRIHPVRRRIGLPPAAATAAAPHGAPAPAAAAATTGAAASSSSSIRGSEELRWRRRCARCGSSKTLVAAALLPPHAPCIAEATHARRKRGPARAGAQLINGGLASSFLS
jgi:hypothetical protein